MSSSRSRTSQSGFTLIEMIVSLGVFSVVVTIAVGALLILIASNRQLQDEQAILSNLSFALDSMSREIRTGSQYYCDSRANDNGSTNVFGPNDLDALRSIGDTNDCEDGRSRNGSGEPNGSGRLHGISFVEGGDSITEATGSERILYFHDSTDGKLYRRIADNEAESIVSDGIYVTDADFFVTGSSPLLGSGAADNHQASVTIFLEAAASDVPGAKKHFIQTTVTQRTLDI